MMFKIKGRLDLFKTEVNMEKRVSALLFMRFMIIGHIF